MDYDTSDKKLRQYQYGADAAATSPKYPLLARYGTANKNGSYEDNYSRFYTGATVDTSNGNIEATAFIKTGATSSDVLLGDGTTSGLKTINNTSLFGSGNMTINADTSACELLVNKVTSISSSSTDTQYPSAKLLYDTIGDIELALDLIINGSSS